MPTTFESKFLLQTICDLEKPLVRNVEKAVDDFMNTLVPPEWNYEPIAVGSMHEGTRLNISNEFDGTSVDRCVLMKTKTRILTDIYPTLLNRNYIKSVLYNL